MEKAKKLNEAINVEGYTITPWSLGVVEELAPCFQRITLEMVKNGITFDNAEKEFPKIILSVLPEVSQILSVTLKEDIEKVKEFQLDKVVTLILTIATQNIGYLKNCLSPMTEMVRNLTKIT